MSPSRGTVAVVGAGITGLAAAHHLRRTAPNIDVILFEKSSRVGGKIKTRREGSLILDQGPDIFLASKPAGVQLCHAAGIGDRVISTNPECRRSFIQRKGNLVPLPAGLTGLIPASPGAIVGSPLLSWKAKARMAFDLVIPPRKTEEDESLEAFIRRRLGKEVFDRLVGPLLGGIYGGDAGQLSLMSTFPQYRTLEREHGSLIRGIASRQKKRDENGSTKKTAGFVSMAGGMSVMPTAVADALGPVVSTGSMVESIQRDGERFVLEMSGVENVGECIADVVIVTTPSYIASELLRTLDDDIVSGLNSLSHGSTAVINMAFDRDHVPHDLNGYGYLVPESEKNHIRACTWTSSKIPDRAPDGTSLFRIFAGRRSTDPAFTMSDDQLTEIAVDELRRTLGVRSAPRIVDVTRWNRSMPRYVMGHQNLLAQLDRGLARQPGLYLAGCSYRGVGIPDCIADGQRSASAAIEYLGSN